MSTTKVMFAAPVPTYRHVSSGEELFSEMLFDVAMIELEAIDSSIVWGSGNKPTEDCGIIMDIDSYICYNNGRLYHASDLNFNKASKYTVLDDITELVHEVRMAKNPLQTVMTTNLNFPLTTENNTKRFDATLDKTDKIKAKNQTMWNCTCSNCKGNAYQSPFSFECENGCKGATSMS